jgi:hypothetical protein
MIRDPLRDLPAPAPRRDASASVPRKLTSTGARRTELTNAMPAKIEQLKEEREVLQRRLEENGNAMHRATNEEPDARRVVDDLKNKITAARDSFTQYKQLRAEKAAA